MGFYRKKTEKFKDKYTSIVKDGKTTLENVKTKFDEDKKSFASLKDNPKTEGAKRLYSLRKRLLPLVFIFALILLFNDYFAVSFVEGTSMFPTLKDNQFVVVSRKESLEYGDIIVLTDNKFPEVQSVVKRLIGFGGDTIKCVNGYIYRNGEIVDEPYAYLSKTEDFDQITVPQNEVFILGDNRENSIDSRKVGTLSIHSIIGKVV